MRIPIPQNKDGSFTITPKKHTKVRRPMSKWWVNISVMNYPARISASNSVRDITTGLENPLRLFEPEIIDISTQYGCDRLNELTKPSLWKRLKRKGRK